MDAERDADPSSSSVLSAFIQSSSNTLRLFFFMATALSRSLQQFLVQRPALSIPSNSRLQRLLRDRNSMMFNWGPCSRIAEYVQSLRTAESELIQLTHKFKSDPNDHLDVRAQDTTIPRSALPITRHGCHVYDKDHGEEYLIHGVKVVSTNYRQAPSSSEASSSSSGGPAPPLVLLHGYMNGSSYFYRNFGGLAHYFPSIYSIDWLGWGLSSRPTNLFDGQATDVQAEDVFCASLESWREKNGIDRMVLAGHSMGGYLSVAYCERYPDRVEKLVLISPVGVPDTPPPGWAERQDSMGFRTRMFFKTFRFLFNNEYTPGSVLRSLPTSRTRSMVESYVKNRLPAVVDDDERKSLSDYLYYSALLPGSAEYCVSKFLTTPYLLAKRPLVDRIPHLRVPSVTFLYGSHDWMDCTGGLASQLRSDDRRRRGEEAPEIGVYRVDRAGHLLMLDNYQEFNAGVALASRHADQLVKDGSVPLPTRMDPVADMPSLDLPGNHEFARMQHRVASRRMNRSSSSNVQQPESSSPPQPVVE
jgi:cardiolipin-specific phospholipase